MTSSFKKAMKNDMNVFFDDDVFAESFQDDSGRSFTGVLDRNYQPVELYEGKFSSYSITLTLKESDLGGIGIRGLVKQGRESYRVGDIERDGAGATTLYLLEV
jgi:hypothetical protein